MIAKQNRQPTMHSAYELQDTAVFIRINIPREWQRRRRRAAR
jgi:hypothetical protein